jgi:hypothetical protein
MKMKTKAGRPRVGTPVSITLTEAQLEWIWDQIPEGGTFTQTVRSIIDKVRLADATKKISPMKAKKFVEALVGGEQ